MTPITGSDLPELREEKRIEPRVQAAYQIAFEYFLGGVKISQGTALTVNISERGALITLPHAADLSAVMILYVHAPLYTLVVRGNVVHSRQEPDGSFHVGLQITDSIEGNWAHLKRDARTHLSENEIEG